MVENSVKCVPEATDSLRQAYESATKVRLAWVQVPEEFLREQNQVPVLDLEEESHRDRIPVAVPDLAQDRGQGLELVVEMASSEDESLTSYLSDATPEKTDAAGLSLLTGKPG